MFLLRKLSIEVTSSILPIKVNVPQLLLQHGDKLRSNLLCCNTCRTEECSLLTTAHTLACQLDKRTQWLGSCHSCCSLISISALGRQKPQSLQKRKINFLLFSSVQHLSSKSPLCLGSGHFCFLTAAVTYSVHALVL